MMLTSEERRNMNKIKRDCRSGSLLNTVVFNVNNSLTHEMAKAKACYFLKKAGIKFITEAEFEEVPYIADIYCLTGDEVIEITYSETKEHALAKNFPVTWTKVIDSLKELSSEDVV